MPEAGSERGSSPEPSEPKQTVQVIRITQMAYLGVVVLLFCVFFAFVGWPIGLWWLLLLPVAAAVWIERTRTTVSEEGLDLRTVFGSRHLDWTQLAGVSIPKRGFVRAHLTDDTEVKLPAISYDRLRELIRASNGRIPDLFAAEAPAREAEHKGRETESNEDEAAAVDAFAVEPPAPESENGARDRATDASTDAPETENGAPESKTEVRDAESAASDSKVKAPAPKSNDA